MFAENERIICAATSCQERWEKKSLDYEVNFKQGAFKLFRRRDTRKCRAISLGFQDTSSVISSRALGEGENERKKEFVRSEGQDEAAVSVESIYPPVALPHCNGGGSTHLHNHIKRRDHK